MILTTVCRRTTIHIQQFPASATLKDIVEYRHCPIVLSDSALTILSTLLESKLTLAVDRNAIAHGIYLTSLHFFSFKVIIAVKNLDFGNSNSRFSIRNLDTIKMAERKIFQLSFILKIKLKHTMTINSLGHLNIITIALTIEQETNLLVLSTFYTNTIIVCQVSINLSTNIAIANHDTISIQTAIQVHFNSIGIIEMALCEVHGSRPCINSA